MSLPLTNPAPCPLSPVKKQLRQDVCDAGSGAVLAHAAFLPPSHCSTAHAHFPLYLFHSSCGKTFATRAVVQYWAAQGKRVAMAAPTGRAAQRLQEIVAMPGLEASTIHRCGRYMSVLFII